LINSLRCVAQLRGEFTFTNDAKPLFEEIYDHSTPSENDDEATTAYKTSSWAHATKLAMVLSAARGNSLRVEREDMEAAIGIINEVSKDLPMVFRAVGESNLVAAAERILRFIEDRGYATLQEIIRTQWRHASEEDIIRILSTFMQGNMIAQFSKGGKTVYQVTNQGSSKGGSKP
jgi:hypothetical protein